MSWVIVDRPGQSGFKKDELEGRWNVLYGVGKWRKAWSFNGDVIEQEMAFLLCEDAYYADSFRRPEVWRRLLSHARDVYDIAPEEIMSGMDYSKQHKYTRFHDIAIRKVLFRRGWRFSGQDLIRIRWENDNPDWFSENFDPGKVPFHMPQMIIKPKVNGWWDQDSVEDFYQSNKVLQALKE